jgi:hypothetical protein
MPSFFAEIGRKCRRFSHKLHSIRKMAPLTTPLAELNFQDNQALAIWSCQTSAATQWKEAGHFV